ncbi:hypothetical protein M8C21_033525 [Ambrosia artemisiifolia]|uniref:GCF C-terminal domain-containing protein n=1 Tax=Ambrosia artemisiifolia TaxID=4212 RepID=A0AAD5C957_AMBAR|nr:hypothetical protein M8C21_033525 [Ambrosia artemisiifolia]
MSGRVRNFRRRTDTDDNDDDTTNTTPTTTTTKKPQPKPTTTTTTTTTTQKPKKPSLLSFADDESTDDVVSIRPRPSNTNNNNNNRPPSSSRPSIHKLTSAKDRNSSKTRTGPGSASGSSLPSNVQPQAGIYTKETLLELQKNSKTLGTRSRPPVPNPEPVIVLKGMIKPGSDNNNVNSNNNNDRLVNRKDEGEELERDEDELIPDQAMIDAIRAKRERLRQSRAAAPDFIALDGGSNHGEAEGLSDEEPEFRGRIALIGEKSDVKKGVFEDVGVDLSKAAIRKESEVSFSEDGGGVDEEDEEDKMWEEEQVRKGLGKRMDDGVVGRGGSGSGVPTVVQSVQQRVVYPTVTGSSYASGSGGLSIGGSLGVSAGLDTLSIAQQAEVSKKALLDSVRRLKETHSRTLTLLTKTDETLADSLAKVTSLENALAAADEKFIFMQKLRDYVSVICDFLQDKAPFIEELEYQMQKLHKERAEAIFERRTADSNDELTELEASVNAAMAVFNKGGTSTSMVEAASTAAQAALTASRESKNLPVKLDEFGRDVNLQNRMDMKRRAEARQRRKARSESKRMSSMETDSLIEGESSTDESDDDSSAYESNLVRTLCSNFLNLRDDYNPAVNWVSKLLARSRHGLLYDYGMPDDKSEVNPDDADVNLVPDLVEKVAIPILQHELAHCWDMLSTKETKNAVSATNLVFTYVPLSSKAVSELVSVLHDRLSEAVSHLMVPTWNSFVLKAVPNAARFAAYRFGTAVRLLRNICLWNNILSMSVLEKLALDELLSGKILPHLRSIQSNIDDAITRTERVVASISGVWSGPKVTGDRSPRLQPMVDYLIVLGRLLEKKQSYSGNNGLARRLKKMLVELNEYDHARQISRTFNLKEAL